MSNFSPQRSASPTRKCLHAVDRSPNYNLEEAASLCKHFHGVARPSAAAEFIEKKSLVFSSFTPSQVFPVVVGRGPIFPVYGDMARQVDRQKRSEKVTTESPQRERQHEALAKVLSDIRAGSPCEFIKQPPVTAQMRPTRPTSPMLEVAVPGISRAMAYEPRGTSLVSIGGVVQPFIRPASAAAGSLELVVHPRPRLQPATDGKGIDGVPDDCSVSCPSMPAVAGPVASATSSTSEQQKVGPLKVVYGAPPASRPGSAVGSTGATSRCSANAPEDLYKINVLLRSRPASGSTRPTPAEHYPLRSIVL